MGGLRGLCGAIPLGAASKDELCNRMRTATLDQCGVSLKPQRKFQSNTEMNGKGEDQKWAGLSMTHSLICLDHPLRLP